MSRKHIWRGHLIAVHVLAVIGVIASINYCRERIAERAQAKRDASARVDTTDLESTIRELASSCAAPLKADQVMSRPPFDRPEMTIPMPEFVDLLKQSKSIDSVRANEVLGEVYDKYNYMLSRGCDTSEANLSWDNSPRFQRLTIVLYHWKLPQRDELYVGRWLLQKPNVHYVSHYLLVEDGNVLAAGTLERRP